MLGLFIYFYHCRAAWETAEQGPSPLGCSAAQHLQSTTGNENHKPEAPSVHSEAVPPFVSDLELRFCLRTAGDHNLAFAFN